MHFKRIEHIYYTVQVMKASSAGIAPKPHLGFVAVLPVAPSIQPSTQPRRIRHAYQPRPCVERCSRLYKCSAAQPQKASKVWHQVRTAVPLSRAFADHLGEDALHHLTEHKYKVVCPFHNDRNPSLNIDDSLGVFHCFGCGAKGTIIDFEQLISGHRSISTALKSLARKYAVVADILQISPSATLASPEDDLEPIPQKTVKPPVRVPRRVRLTQSSVARDVLRKLAAVYEACLWDEPSSEALLYLLNSRKFSSTTLRIFGCGFAPPSVRSDFALKELQDSGFPPEHAVLAGVARVTENSTNEDSPRFYDIFRNRVVTPIRDLQGDTVALAGRVLPGASVQEAKYINSPATILFKKQNLLFGADLAKRAPSAKANCGYVIVFEGYFDVISLFDCTQGRVGCVAAMGASLSPKQLHVAYDLLADKVDGRVIINFDGDDAGKKAVERLCDSVIPDIFEVAHIVYIAEPPPPIKDADEFLSTVGNADEYVTYLLESAMPWYEWRGYWIVQRELERLNGMDPVEVDTPTEPLKNQAEFGETSLHYKFALASELRRQRDEMMVAFGAPPELLKHDSAKKKVRPQCSEKVIDQLAEVVNKALRVLPGLNVSALVQSWADLLSYSEPAEMLDVYQRLMRRIQKLTKPWSHLTAEAQIYWLPPPPWLLEDLSPKRLKEVSEASGYIPDGATDEEIESFLKNKTRVKRSLEKMEYQSEKIIPLLQQDRCEQVKRLQIAPRRSAEEIILRALIFANENDRVNALAEVLDIIIRCQKKGLSFWTSDKRMQLFETLATLEGPTTYEEIAAYVEEHEWFSAEIEELFVPLTDIADHEWRAIRAMEIKSPVKAAKSAASSVEEMSRRVKSRIAVSDVNDNMAELLALEAAKPDSEKEAEERDKLKEALLAQHVALRKQIDQTEFMTESELEKTWKAVEEAEEEKRWELERAELLSKLQRREKIEFPRGNGCEEDLNEIGVERTKNTVNRGEEYSAPL